MRARNERLTELVHELRGPLGPIEMAITLLRTPHTETHARAVAVLERQTQIMKRLIQDLSELACHGHEGLTMKLESVEVAAVIERAVELASPLVQARQHRILVDVSQGLVVEGDLVRLVQVFSNLIGNASKYTDYAGTICITGKRDNSSARIKVSDNGIGISKQALPRIFELFVRSPRAEKTHEGLGVGLHVVRALVAQHGGTVSAHSEGPGAGSEFTVTLPLAQAPHRVRASQSSVAIESAPACGRDA